VIPLSFDAPGKSHDTNTIGTKELLCQELPNIPSNPAGPINHTNNIDNQRTYTTELRSAAVEVQPKECNLSLFDSVSDYQIESICLLMPGKQI
jgi:hypothetical protein